jgi:hypothetical protein
MTGKIGKFTAESINGSAGLQTGCTGGFQAARVECAGLETCTTAALESGATVFVIFQKSALKAGRNR